MGWPLTGVALLVTLWAVRQADRALDLASNDEQSDELPSGQTDRST